MRISDWSSDVCSSDLLQRAGDREDLLVEHGDFLDRHSLALQPAQEGFGDCHQVDAAAQQLLQDRKSVVEGKSVSVRVDLGGRRIIKKKKKKKKKHSKNTHNIKKES